MIILKRYAKGLVALGFILGMVQPLTSAAQTKIPTELIVAQDGTGDYKTIQEAVNAVRDFSQQQVTIHIRKGIYHEKIVVPTWKTHVFLLGDDAGYSGAMDHRIPKKGVRLFRNTLTMLII